MVVLLDVLDLTPVFLLLNIGVANDPTSFEATWLLAQHTENIPNLAGNLSLLPRHSLSTNQNTVTSTLAHP